MSVKLISIYGVAIDCYLGGNSANWREWLHKLRVVMLMMFMDTSRSFGLSEKSPSYRSFALSVLRSQAKSNARWWLLQVDRVVGFVVDYIIMYIVEIDIDDRNEWDSGDFVMRIRWTFS